MKDQSRRQLLLNSMKGAFAIALAPVLSSLLSSCKKKDQASAKTEAKEGGAGSSCPGEDSLNSDAKTARATLKYVDNSTISNKTCDNCRFYTRPPSGNICGGCQVLPGPVHPKGYCTSWVAQM